MPQRGEVAFYENGEEENMTKLDIISGFLGSGKTTLIQKLLETVYQNDRVYIVENESGAVKLESIANPNKVKVKQILNGCLCCSDDRDLNMTMKNILKDGTYERVIIEPSGMARLSDLFYLLQEQIKSGQGKIDHVVTVVDVKSFDRRMMISQGFFENQLRNSPLVYLSKLDRAEEKEAERVRERIRDLQPDCVFLEQNLGNWKELGDSLEKITRPGLEMPSSFSARERGLPLGSKLSFPSGNGNELKGSQPLLLDEDLFN